MQILGYGHVYPLSENSQMMCMLYTVIGLPIAMVFLANIGGVFADILKYCFSRICCRWCRAKRKLSEKLGKGMKPALTLMQENVGDEDYMPTKTVIR